MNNQSIMRQTMVDQTMMRQTMMRQTMRWFGPDDKVSLNDIRQAGCEGVVSALHHVPNGEVWSISEIAKRKKQITDHGLSWDVVESLPVHESIKTRTGDYKDLIENYKQSLVNLASQGIRVVTYNFMPLLDWTRTDLHYVLDDGAVALRYDADQLAMFDIFILNRHIEEHEYSDAQRIRARLLYDEMSNEEQGMLEKNIVLGMPGSEEAFSKIEFLNRIETYKGISEAQYRLHLIAFLQQVCPIADRLGIRLALHPDDPPFSLFGLPRIVSTDADISEIFARVPNVSNGLCFCAGSLSILKENRLVDMLRKFSDRVYFLHLRNTQHQDNGSFYESRHLEGSIDMYALVKAIVEISARRQERIPMRPDHGHRILDDLKKTTNPGYCAIGRLKGLAEIRGLEMGIVRSMDIA